MTLHKKKKRSKKKSKKDKKCTKRSVIHYDNSEKFITILHFYHHLHMYFDQETF